MNCKSNEGVLLSQSTDVPDTEVERSESKDVDFLRSRCAKEDFPEIVMNKEKNFPSMAFTLAVDGDSEEPVVVISQW